MLNGYYFCTWKRNIHNKFINNNIVLNKKYFTSISKKKRVHLYITWSISIIIIHTLTLK